MEAWAGHDTWDRLAEITAATLVIWAVRRPGAPDDMQRLAERIPGGALQFFDNGRMFLLQDRSA